MSGRGLLFPHIPSLRLRLIIPIMDIHDIYETTYYILRHFIGRFGGMLQLKRAIQSLLHPPAR
jgi:hypothetical protein